MVWPLKIKGFLLNLFSCAPAQEICCANVDLPHSKEGLWCIFHDVLLL